MILIALGSNLPGRHGGPPQELRAAQIAMEQVGIKILKSSCIWKTAPVPTSDQPWYHNMVVQAETGLSAFTLLETLQNIEHSFGRVRTERNAPRIMDLDLIAYNDEIIDRPELIVPHPRMHERAFVLLPLREIAPKWIHPVSRKPLSALIAALPEGQEAETLEENPTPSPGSIIRRS